MIYLIKYYNNTIFNKNNLIKLYSPVQKPEIILLDGI